MPDGYPASAELPGAYDATSVGGRKTTETTEKILMIRFCSMLIKPIAAWWSFGYPGAIIFMMLAGLAPYLYFKRKNWL